MSESSNNQPYQVLARKYRPMSFEDMIGQETMVKTLTNAFSASRVAHAFMLTGVRGIGKTTTARLLARALNYSGPHEGPSVDLLPPGEHCEAINESRHQDVMEMDAASRTGVGDIREILDSVRYGPVLARYKVYIIDEVHMLSTSAFNALLKTLEEPPDHAKFIFATTEIHKVPITVLSRCQRFDLRRVEADALAAHLTKICEAEDVRVSPGGLALISRAAEGSVRDALSLLDQAIVQSGLDGSEVTLEQVRDMLGLADRTRVLDLFSQATMGDGAGALTEMRAQYDDGAEPTRVMRDLMDVCHEVSRSKALGDGATFDAAPDQVERLQKLASGMSMGEITRTWQLLTQAYNDVRQSPTPLAAAEMALLRLAVASELPSPELAAQLLAQIDVSADSPIEKAEKKTKQIAAPKSAAPERPSVSERPSASVQPMPSAQVINAKPAPETETNLQPVTALHSLQDIADLLARENKASLRYDVETYVRLIKIAPFKLSFEPAPGAPKALAQRLSKFLQDATGETWMIEPDSKGKGEPSLAETKKAAAKREHDRIHAHPAFSHPLLQGAKLLEIRDRAPTSTVIEADFGSGSNSNLDD